MVGSYMGRVCTVSSQKILTPSNLKGSAGSDWANHEIIGRKARSQWVGPKLKSYTMEYLGITSSKHAFAFSQAVLSP